MKDLLQSKTFWGGVAGIITAVGGYFTGTLDIDAAAQLGVTSLLAIFLRHGIAKHGQKRC